MKRYIVTEDDLQRLEDLAYDYARGMTTIDRIALFQARKVVRAVEVPEGSTHFATKIPHRNDNIWTRWKYKEIPQ